MATSKKLDTFILKDEFNLPEAELLKQAQASAFRRAEMSGWVDVSVARAAAPVSNEGSLRCFSFDIFGVDSSTKNDSIKDQKTRIAIEPPSGIAAA